MRLVDGRIRTDSRWNHGQRWALRNAGAILTGSRCRIITARPFCVAMKPIFRQASSYKRDTIVPRHEHPVAFPNMCTMPGYFLYGIVSDAVRQLRYAAGHSRSAIVEAQICAQSPL